MFSNPNGEVRFKKVEKVKAYNCARCDQEMLEEHKDDWQDPCHPDGESVKLCNSCYGLVAIVEDNRQG